MNKENKTFCPKCNKEVNYTIRKELMAEYKGEKVNDLFNYLQNTIDYNFERKLQKCFKKSKNDDPGMETFGWMNNEK